MGQICIPKPVKLVLGMFSGREELFAQACHKLSENWGRVDLFSPVFPFNYTDYYQEEMGAGLLRQFVSFTELIKPQKLAECKLLSNKIEMDFIDEHNNRLINLDPGYLEESKLILASTKNFAHRIYLDQGIFAEVTLQYRRKDGWQDLPWTYPDYSQAKTKDFLNRVRRQYRQQLGIK